MTMVREVRRGTLLERFGAFVAERAPFALRPALEALEDVLEGRGGDPGRDAARIDSMREPLRNLLGRRLEETHRPVSLFGADLLLPETTPGVDAKRRLVQARGEVIGACDGFLRRESIAASLTPEERREILRGMILTRATDNRLKAFFTGGEVRWGNASFQGKGFRSLGQEAIYASIIRLRRGEAYRGPDGSWRGDVIAPMIRDLGAVLGMKPDAAAVRTVLNAQMAKAGPPMDGRDLHVGAFAHGVIPPAAPLAIPAMTAAGMAFGFQMRAEDRVAVAFNGEGGTSMGEWHEAINLAAARRLPIVFCVQNNQTALSTPVHEQTAVRVFADKGVGYGIPAITIDGTDPDAIAAAFTWAAERARDGKGPSLIELVAMRMCGHAHHDDMLYLGRDPQPSWSYPRLTAEGYASRESWKLWSARDPIPGYAARLESEGVIGPSDAEGWKKEAEELVEREARSVVEAPWPDPDLAGRGVFAGEPPRRRVEVLEREHRARAPLELPPLDPGPPVDPKGKTLLEAVMLGVRDALRADPRTFVYGEDVGGRYGNAFLLLRPLLEELGDRIINSPVSEGGVIGVCIGAAMAGMRPIGEMQFNDFVATGFNQLVNSAAKTRYRFGESVPMVLRMPWGGLRHAGPYHSQNTEPWFYRTAGLKIVAPSTPHDARGMMAAAVADPDPVLYYEHIALYRDPRVKQALADEPPPPIAIGKAALRRAGDDLAIVSYGAYAHLAMRVAETLAGEGVAAAVLDLRTLAPLDRDAVLALARHCSRMLVVHEDSRTGGIGESIAAIVQEEAFEWLDAPVRVVGALDTPVPYSPPLEQAYLASEADVLRAARAVMAW
ncbi:MAG TPA: thiamine pyrophosphate-dependent enzyme [Thermoanaerobaculia bacterium]|nr:thiamine pyrophosphate-dependent enzyme [Thermoanaerobaculia bacterium]